MELTAAKRIGGGLSIRSLFVLVVLYELFLLVMETRGDFANGILFFIAGQLNPFIIIGYAVLFTTTYFLGRNAGKEIIIRGNNFVWIGFRNALLLLFVFGCYLASYNALTNNLEGRWQLVWMVLLWTSLPVIVTWLWSSWRIKLRSNGS